MAGTKAATLMSCGERAPVPHSEQTSKKASGCCQMSAPVPDQPRSALPDNSFGEFRQETRAQLLDSSEPVSPSALGALRHRWAFLTITFWPDRSDIYLLGSTFRI